MSLVCQKDASGNTMLMRMASVVRPDLSTRDEQLMALHRFRNMLIRYIEELPANEIPDPDLILKGSVPLKTYFSNMRNAGRESLVKYNGEPDTAQSGFMMKIPCLRT